MKTEVKIPFSKRAELCSNLTAKKLFQLMDKKKSNLGIAADVTKKQELLKIAEEAGPHIVVLKTHIDIVEDFDWDLVEQLKGLAERHEFLLFEDRKFADIGNTVKNQYEKGIYRISEWADIVNAHSVPGPGIIQGLAAVGEKLGRGLLLLGEMSSAGNLCDDQYRNETVKMALDYPDFVIGFITQRRLVDDPRFVHMVPGVNLGSSGDGLGQQYRTPEKVFEAGGDLILVGRGIVQAENPKKEAERYQKAGWLFYEEE